jgi:CRISPR-associated protein Csb1
VSGATTPTLTLEKLQESVAGRAAAFRCRSRLQPAGGAGDKVFPPTYAGAVYAMEQRRVPVRRPDGSEGFETATCVLLDSVQSQANRMEEALQDAIDQGRLKLPVIEVDFSDFWDPKGANEKLGDDLRLLDPVGKVTSLQAPHRIADAILRESMLNGQRFRDTEVGRQIGTVSTRNATALFEVCPTALLLGMWDSTGPKGGLGAKFERAMVSEIVGINATYGVRTASRVDPVIRKNPPLYESRDGRWTAVEADAATSGAKSTPKKYGKKLSELNLGNVTPDLVRYSSKSITSDNRETIDVMREDGAYIAAGRVAPGGVTIDHAEQTIVISLPALRRLRFPINGTLDTNVDTAAQTVLAALGLCAAALADEAGLDLRSRCLLYSEDNLTWTLLKRGQEDGFKLSPKEAIDLLNAAVAAAKDTGLSWREEPLVLRPSDELVKLVVKSQRLAIEQGGDSGEGGE